MRVDCGCQSEPETEASRSSHSTCEYSHQSEKQIQRRLLPQPVVSPYTKQFADYSGCSQSTASRSLLVSSTHSGEYEEVLCISVPSSRETEELTYSCIDDSVVCKPPGSIGVINNNFSPDVSSSNNNLVPPETNDNEQLLQGGGRENGSGSDNSSNVSSASSNIDDHNSAEVKYVADIRQFRSTPTSVRPHGDDCCCATCQSDEGFDRTEDDDLIHHSSDLKCSCKSCKDFHSRMQCVHTSVGFTTTVGGGTVSNQYRLMSCIASDENILPTWSQSSSKSSVVYKTPEGPSFSSRSIQPVHKSASASADQSDPVFGAFESEEVDADDGLFSSDDELHYVFHKFIDDSCLEGPFANVSTGDRLRPSAAMQLESGAEVEYSSARSADDLEVAFFMVGSISPTKPPPIFPDTSYVTPYTSASSAISTGHETAVSEDNTTELTAHSFNLITDGSSVVENDSRPYNLNIVCEVTEADTSANTFETVPLNVISESPSESENMSGALKIVAAGPETDIHMDSNLNLLGDENQQAYSQFDDDEVRRDVIVQKLSDNSSFFIAFPRADDYHVCDVLYSDTEDIDISPSEHTGSIYTAQALAPAEDDAFIEQRVLIVTPECIIEHPVFVDDVKSSQTAIYGLSQQTSAADVASYICDLVADAVQIIAADAAGASVGVCDVASEDDISSEWQEQTPITHAPLPSTHHEPATEDEYDRQFDSLPGDMEPQFAGGDVEYCSVETDAVDVEVVASQSDEDISLPDVHVQDVPQVENYLISYDVNMLQQPVDDVDQTPFWSSYSTRPDEDSAHDDMKLHDLVQPLEHVSDIAVASELNLDSEVAVTSRQGADQSTLPATDIVEDFFMQYVLPVDSVGFGMKTDTTAAVAVDEKQIEDVADQRGVDEDDTVTAEKLENAAQNFVDIVISDAIAETSAETSVPDVVAEREVDWELDVLVQATELEAAAQTAVDVIINEPGVSDGITSPGATISDTQPAIPTRSSFLLHSPSEPVRKKSVHFADTHGLQLETVQHYDQAPEPEERPSSLEEFLSKLSAAAAERRAKWTEHHTSPVSSWLCSSSVYLLACFELPGSQEELLERVQHCRVALESCSFDDLALAISGVVRVANIAFNKSISVRYSVDHWTTRSDIDGQYIPLSNDGTTDRFSFTIILPSGKQFVIGSEVEFAICYTAGDGPSFEFWDNNHGRNYVVRCCSKAASSDAKNVNLSSSDNESE